VFARHISGGIILKSSRSFICIVCPSGCELLVKESLSSISVTGNLCEKGIDFAEKEVYNPERVLTTTIKLTTGELVPVRSDGLVKKDEIKHLVKYISSNTFPPPVEIGQVIIPAVGKNKVDIIATAAVSG
jgi:CxxC motif-containing protein